MITIPTSNRAEKPKGAPFYVDRVSFRPGERVDVARFTLADDKVFDWPMVYILANKDTAYVGQTTSIATRMNQHGANEEKRDFDTINVIYNEEFNGSVITDYEHRLIGYMHADGRYKLTNKNEGMTDSNYFSKGAYSAMFEDLWEELRALELADHTIADIEESEVFKCSPFKGLNADQRVALDKIMAAIRDGIDKAEPIVVEGMPGTGKTVLAIYLLKMLRDDPRYKDMNIRIIEPVTSLRKTLQRSLANVSGFKKSDVIGPSDLVKPAMGFEPGKGKCFDIVLIDEAHKLKRRVALGPSIGNYDKVNETLGLPGDATQMDWVINQAKLPIFFYDPLQSIGPSCVRGDAMRAALGRAAEHPIRLESQMRVKGGDVYLRYVRDILDGCCEGFQKFEGYAFELHKDFGDFLDCFERDYRDHNLSRIVAGYAWEWKTKPGRKLKEGEVPSEYDIEIDGVRLRWNCTNENWVGLGVEDPRVAREVGCIHSIQGYDLSYAYVIIGRDLLFNGEKGKPESNKEGYFDSNGKVKASKDEHDRYIKNIYYVLLTRGILGTHVYVEDPTLRGYFAQYFQQSV